MKNTDAKKSLVEKLQKSTNILVTVSNNPTVDQLAACLGLTIWLNKAEKHATAVFSGDVPSTLEFLEPEETLEKNTDSLRDFIIALDKSKADKLRYKVEDAVVKIFITPYRTSLSADDLEYSQGDFNVDMVIALGVTNQEDIDNAITAHGRILHDATVVTINVNQASELGAVNWQDEQASSLSELIVDLGNSLDKAKLDGQIATALLTGVVAETERFSNEKTTPQTMSVSAELMSAGANQQLVASKLEEPAPEPEPVVEPESETEAEPEAEQTEEPPKDTPKPDGTLEIDHQFDEPKPEEASEEPAPELTLPEPETAEEQPAPEVEETPLQPEEPAPEEPAAEDTSRGLVVEPPTLGGTLTANSRPDDMVLEPTSDPLTLATTEPAAPILGHGGQMLAEETPEVEGEQPQNDAPVVEVEAPTSDTEAPAAPETPAEPQPAPPDWMPKQDWMDAPAADAPAEPAEPQTPAPTDTLADIERSVQSPHMDGDLSETPNLNSARDEVLKAINSEPANNFGPIEALNAEHVDLNPPTEPETPAAPEMKPIVTEDAPVEPAPAPVDSMAFDPTQFEIANDSETMVQPVDPNQPAAPDLTGPVEQPFTMPLPGSMSAQPVDTTPPTSNNDDPTAPPPVPPPLMPPGFPPAQ